MFLTCLYVARRRVRHEGWVEHRGVPGSRADGQDPGGVAPERCLAVRIDVAKVSWHLLVANFLGEVVMAGVDIVADEAGYAEVRKRIDQAAAATQAQVVRVGVESAGHYHETLAGRLMADGYEVIGHNPAAVKTARAQSGKGRTKTDGLDAAAMCSLTIRGLGRRPYLPVDAVGKLQVAYLGREALASHRSALRNQITSLLDLIWPGATAEDKDRGAGPPADPGDPRGVTGPVELVCR